MSGSDVHDWSYYKKCMAGGILSCGITHALVCPLDIVKCRMQVSIQNQYLIFNAVFLKIGYARSLQRCRRWILTNLQIRGYDGLLHRKYILSSLLTINSIQGFFPTWIGYSFQGFGKFGFYEMFKDVYRNAMGSDEKIKKYQTLGFALSSACAEIIADCFLCPWEAVSTLFIVFFEMFQKIKQLYLDNFLTF